MPRKKIPKQCGCGCGEFTAGGDFKPGHDSKTLSAILERVGGVLKLKAFIEKELNETIKVEHEVLSMVKKNEAIKRLKDAGHYDEAKELDNWRDKNGNNWGWDGWIRREYNYVESIIWPDEPKSNMS